MRTRNAEEFDAILEQHCQRPAPASAGPTRKARPSDFTRHRAFPLCKGGTSSGRPKGWGSRMGSSMQLSGQGGNLQRGSWNWSSKCPDGCVGRHPTRQDADKAPWDRASPVCHDAARMMNRTRRCEGDTRQRRTKCRRVRMHGSMCVSFNRVGVVANWGSSGLHFRLGLWR